MALARAVTFEGVDSQHMAELSKQIENDPRPDDIPATEILMLHDEAADTSLVILFFENEDDYARGDAALNAMTPGDTPVEERPSPSTRSPAHDRLTLCGGMPAPLVCRRTYTNGGSPSAPRQSFAAARGIALANGSRWGQRRPRTERRR